MRCSYTVECYGSVLLMDALTAAISSTPKERLRYHRRMAVIHISRTDAANDFDGLIARAGKGDEILIESNTCVVARLLPGDAPRTRLLSESLRILKERGSTITLDGDFGRDLEEIISSHLEPLNPPCQSHGEAI
jgi:antitoxin (DNA-binding transcriptional repressor) of toxin-antitoxin stability system